MWVYGEYGFQVIGVVLQIWRWSHGGYDRRCLADLEVVLRWCSFAVVRGFAISFAVVLGFADLRSSGCRWVLQWVKMWLPVVVLL